MSVIVRNGPPPRSISNRHLPPNEETRDAQLKDLERRVKQLEDKIAELIRWHG